MFPTYFLAPCIIQALEQQIKDMSIRYLEEKNTYGEERKDLLEAAREAQTAKESAEKELEKAKAVSC